MSVDSFIITASQGRGKTTMVLHITRILKCTGLSVSGIAAPVVYESGRRIGYDILDLTSGIRIPWMRIQRSRVNTDVGPFTILPEGVEVSRGALMDALSSAGGIVFIDEIGPLELQNRGHAWFMERFHECTAGTVIITARPSIASEIRSRWDTGSEILSISQRHVVYRRLGIHGGLCDYHDPKRR